MSFLLPLQSSLSQTTPSIFLSSRGSLPSRPRTRVERNKLTRLRFFLLPRRPLMTPFTETKLYSYMFVLCLMVDNFVVDLNDLAKELNMEPTKFVFHLSLSLPFPRSSSSIFLDSSSLLSSRDLTLVSLFVPPLKQSSSHLRLPRLQDRYSQR